MTHKKTDSIPNPQPGVDPNPTDPLKMFLSSDMGGGLGSDDFAAHWNKVESYAKANPNSDSARWIASQQAKDKADTAAGKYTDTGSILNQDGKDWWAKHGSQVETGVQIAGAIGSSIGDAVKNTANNIWHHPFQAIGGRVANFVSDLGSSAWNIGANLSNAEFGTNIPNVHGPKSVENDWRGEAGSHDVGGSLVRNPAKGTKGSLGIVVPGDPMASITRGLDVASWIPGAGTGAKGVGRGVTSALDRVAADGIATGARAAISRGTQKVVSPVLVAAALMSPAHVADTAATSTLRQVPGISRSIEDSLNPVITSASHDIPDAAAKAQVNQATAGAIAKADQVTHDAIKPPEEVRPGHEQRSESNSTYDNPKPAPADALAPKEPKPKEDPKKGKPKDRTASFGSSAFTGQEAEIPRLY